MTTRYYPGIDELYNILRMRREIEEKQAKAAGMGFFQRAKKAALQKEIADLQRKEETKRQRVLDMDLAGDDPIYLIAKDPEAVPFGRLPETGEPILWQAVRIEDTKALLISRYGLWAGKYNYELEDVTWETCSLRGQLNGEFLEEAFNDEERRRIEPYFIFDSPGRVSDRVFVPSDKEVMEWYPTAVQLRCQGLDLVKEGCSGADSLVCWWLRTTGDYPSYVRFILPEGACAIDGAPVDMFRDPEGFGASDVDYPIYVRPAISIQLFKGYIKGERKSPAAGTDLGEGDSGRPSDKDKWDNAKW